MGCFCGKTPIKYADRRLGKEARATEAIRPGTGPAGWHPIYVHESIATLPRSHINGGARGLLVTIDLEKVTRVPAPTRVDVALDK